ncbi:MAG: hypothetical protein WAU65_02175 [Candidatus Nanoarchaeia archaeon]
MESEIDTLTRQEAGELELALATELVDTIEEGKSFEEINIKPMFDQYITQYKENKKLGCADRKMFDLVMMYVEKYGQTWGSKEGNRPSGGHAINLHTKLRIDDVEARIANEIRGAISRGIHPEGVRAIAQEYYKTISDDTGRWGYYNSILFNEMHPIIQEYIVKKQNGGNGNGK